MIRSVDGNAVQLLSPLHRRNFGVVDSRGLSRADHQRDALGYSLRQYNGSQHVDDVFRYHQSGGDAVLHKHFRVPTAFTALFRTT